MLIAGSVTRTSSWLLAARCSLKLIFTIMMQKLEKLSIASVATMKTITIWLLL